MRKYFGQLQADENRILEQANQVVGNVILAGVNNDFTLFLSLFDPSVADKVTPKSLENLQSRLTGKEIPIFIASVRKCGRPCLLYVLNLGGCEDDLILSLIVNDENSSFKLLGVWIS